MPRRGPGARPGPLRKNLRRHAGRDAARVVRRVRIRRRGGLDVRLLTNVPFVVGFATMVIVAVAPLAIVPTVQSIAWLCGLGAQRSARDRARRAGNEENEEGGKHREDKGVATWTMHQLASPGWRVVLTAHIYRDITELKPNSATFFRRLID